MNKAFVRAVYHSLQNYPKKALCAGPYYDKETDLCCVLGTVPEFRRYATGGYPATGNNSPFQEICESLGGTWMDARDVSLASDTYQGTPEARYAFMMQWLQSRL